MSKLESARARIIRAKEMFGDAVCVGFSGGKDSLVSTDLLVQHFGRVEAFFMYLCRGLRCVEEPLEGYAKRWGIKLHYVPHFDRARLMKHAIASMQIVEGLNLPILKQRDVENYITQQTGIRLFCYGERASDSFIRRFYTRENDGLRLRGNPKLYPIWNWLDGDVYGYMRARRIPAPTRYGRVTRTKMSGMTLRDETVLWLRDNHPEDFRTLCKSFPFLEALLPR